MEKKTGQNVIGLAGYSGSGKTVLLEKILQEMTKRGLRVSTIKHAHHNFDVDKQGKDSHRHRTSGATEVLISSKNRWALMHEIKDEQEPNLTELLEKMAPVDYIIVEGHKNEAHLKIEVHRPENGKPLLCTEISNVIAVATNDESCVQHTAIPALDINNPVQIVDYIITVCKQV